MATDRANPTLTDTGNGKANDRTSPHPDSDGSATVPSELLDALRISEARFRAVFENVDALSIQGYTADGTVRYWNPASSKLYGYSQSEAIGASLYDLIIPHPAREFVRKDVKWMFDHKQGVPAARLTLKHKDGSTVHVYSSHTIVETPDHGAMMYCLDIDLREQVQMEQALSEAEQRYRTLFDGAADAILLLHNDHILDANQAACALFGADHTELCKLTGADLSPTLQADGSNSAVALQRLMADVTAGNNRIFEWRHRRVDGTEFEAETHLTCVSLHGAPHVVGLVRDISARKQAEARIEYLAHHDALTGLPNRILLRDRFVQAKALADRSHSQIALLFVDLDHFKVINDTLGHSTGDVLLKIIAERLRHCVRESDTLSRQGGDEFILLLPDIRSAAVLERLTIQLMAELTEPVTLGEHELTISGSIGVALYPQDGDNFDLLLQHGDMAMYSAKQAGRNKLRFYSATMQVAIDNRISLDTRLRRALKARELQLHYQAQVDSDGNILGAEALIRWFPPNASPVPPLEFIGLAEETGLIISIGRYVLEQACTTLAQWARAPVLSQLTLAVNISARQFRERDFEAIVAEVLQQSGCDPRQLKLELTESVVLDNVDEAIEKMQRLRQLGLGFSLDDFGTGYSSLSYLKRLPLDQVKIDRAFVHHLASDRRDEAIVSAILGMSQAMQLSVIAEGVETSNQYEQLVRLGCKRFQGYLFAKPVAPSEFVQWVQVGGRLPR